MYSLRSRKQNINYCVGNSPEKRKFRRKSTQCAKYQQKSEEGTDNFMEVDCDENKLRKTYVALEVMPNISVSIRPTRNSECDLVIQTKNKSEKEGEDIPIDAHQESELVKPDVTEIPVIKSGENITLTNDLTRKSNCKSVSQINSAFQVEPTDKVEDDNVNDNGSKSSSQIHVDAVGAGIEIKEGGNCSKIINEVNYVSQINSSFQVETVQENNNDKSENDEKDDSFFEIDTAGIKEGGNCSKIIDEVNYVSQISSSFQVETVHENNDKSENDEKDGSFFEIDTVGIKDDGEESNNNKITDSEGNEEDGNVSQINSLFQVDTIGNKDKSDDEDDDPQRRKLFRIDTSSKKLDGSDDDDDDDDDEEEDYADEDDEDDDDVDKGDGHTNVPIFKFPIGITRDESKKRSSESTKKDKGFFNWDDTYLDIQLDTRKGLEVDRNARKFSHIDEIMKKSTITPGFEKLDAVPAYDESDRILKKKRMKERERTKGSKWFNMPATEMTEEMKHDLEVIQMRSVLDPKHFYKKNDLKVLPKYFQVGKVEDTAADFYNSRMPKKQRKRTIVEELLADSDFKRYNKMRYKEIIEERRKTHYKAHNHAKKLKKRKK